MLAGFATLIFMITGWFGTVIGESQSGLYNAQVDKSFRQGMFWFIFSEVMFFAAFFGALFYARNMSIPWLGGESNNFFTNLLLWEGYESTWPTNGPGNIGGEYDAMPPFGLPLINTALLLTSSITVTIAHHALIAGKRSSAGGLPRGNVPARLCVRLPAGRRVRTCLPRFEPDAVIWHLRIDVLHADRFPRHARDDWRNHADDHLLPRAKGAFHA